MTTYKLVASILFAVPSLVLALVGPAAAQKTGSDVLAEINGQAITAEELDKAVGAPLLKLQEQIYSLRRQKLNAMIGERLLAAEAAKRGMSVQQLIDAEVTSKAALVTEQEVEKVYQENKGRFQGEDEAAHREQVRGYLQGQRLASARDAYVQGLQSQAKVVVHLKEPPVTRVEVQMGNGVSRGPESAPVTIVEFTDFHCPFCKRAQPTIAEVIAKYGDKVKHVHRDFPIENLHPQAPPAHLAARCASDQGKFWPYHDKLFAGPPRSDREQLKTYASEVGLDLAAFDQCLSSNKYQPTVQKEIEEGSRLGVTGTPTFFINGRLLVGAQPLSKFVEVIEEELARKPR